MQVLYVMLSNGQDRKMIKNRIQWPRFMTSTPGWRDMTTVRGTRHLDVHVQAIIVTSGYKSLVAYIP